MILARLSLDGLGGEADTAAVGSDFLALSAADDDELLAWLLLTMGGPDRRWRPSRATIDGDASLGRSVGSMSDCVPADMIATTNDRQNERAKAHRSKSWAHSRVVSPYLSCGELRVGVAVSHG